MRRCFNYGKIILYIIGYRKQIVWIRKCLERGFDISGRSGGMSFDGHNIIQKNLCPEIDMIRGMSTERLSLFI